MTLSELEYKLALARQQGADNNTEVRFDAPTGEYYPETYTILGKIKSAEEIKLERELYEVEFRRNGRYEVVLR